MCGDVEDDGSYESDLAQRFLARAHTLLARRPAAGDDLEAYLDRLFADLLGRCVADVEAADASDAYRRMAMQSVVLSRLAGYLAGHAALQEDPLRKVMEAVMHGYGEADPVPAHDHHRHDHGHDHEHDHPHSH